MLPIHKREVRLPFVLSVRKPEHYAPGHIPGTINVYWKNVAEPDNLAQLPTGKQIVVYCYTGHTDQAKLEELAVDKTATSAETEGEG